MKYFRIVESIRIYRTSVNPYGTKFDYAGYVNSNGINIAGIQNELVKNLKTPLWNQYAEII